LNLGGSAFLYHPAEERRLSAASKLLQKQDILSEIQDFNPPEKSTCIGLLGRGVEASGEEREGDSWPSEPEAAGYRLGYACLDRATVILRESCGQAQVTDIL